MLEMLNDEFVRKLYKVRGPLVVVRKLMLEEIGGNVMQGPFRHIVGRTLALVCQCQLTDSTYTYSTSPEHDTMKPIVTTNLHLNLLTHTGECEEIKFITTVGAIWIGRCSLCGTVYWANAGDIPY